MGFPSKKKDKKDKKSSPWRKIGSLFTKKDDSDSVFFAADDYSVELFVRDKDTDKYYKVKYAACFEPRKAKNAKKDLPKNLIFNVGVNLENDEAVEEVDS